MRLLKIDKMGIYQTGALIGVMIVTLLCAACAVEKQARKVEGSGFLGDYSMLSAGDKSNALLLYVNPTASWVSYDKILLDPVIYYRRIEDPKKGLPQEDIQRMVNNFNKLLYQELSKDYEMVTAPGPRTMRMQAAITNVEKTWVGTHTVTSILPVGWVIQGAKDFATGKPNFSGEATLEFMIDDAQTTQLLAAGVDRRVGGRRIKASTDSWIDVNRIMARWSKFARFRLCELRKGTDCVNPVK
jgi:hypothetical protein